MRLCAVTVYVHSQLLMRPCQHTMIDEDRLRGHMRTSQPCQRQSHLDLAFAERIVLIKYSKRPGRAKPPDPIERHILMSSEDVVKQRRPTVMEASAAPYERRCVRPLRL